ncbi:MAG: envelope stress response membrane protein PspB [Rhodospirillaceae bacterium]|nr:envelope stress response membrane protein PspB [Rhodospirillaceae bacterium]
MADAFIALMVPMILFMIFVAPIWVILHYRSKNVTAKSLSDEEQQTLDQLARIAEKMEARMAALEKILESEDPKWKEKAQ